MLDFRRKRKTEEASRPSFPLFAFALRSAPLFFLFTFLLFSFIIKKVNARKDAVFMAENIREPKQKRSIEKKERIIEAGYKLFAEKGYFNTNTAEIAKVAGVSTGIVYGYFHDKRDILLGAMEIYIRKVFTPIFSLLDDISSLDFKKIITSAIDHVVRAHKTNAAMHTTLHSLSSEDEIVGGRFASLEEEMTKKMSEKLISLGYPRERVYEKVHTAMDVIQSIAHEEVYDKHSYIDYFVMRTLVTDMLVRLFEE